MAASGLEVFLRTILSGNRETVEGFREVTQAVSGVGAAAEQQTKHLEDLGDSTEKLSKDAAKDMAEYVGAVTGALAAGAAAAAKFIYDVGKQWDDATDAIIIGTGKSGEELRKFESIVGHVAENSVSDLKAVTSAFLALRAVYDPTSDGFEKLLKSVTDLSRLLGGDAAKFAQEFSKLLVGWKVPAEDATKVLNGLFAVSQKSGVDLNKIIGDLVQFGPTLRASGRDLEHSASLIATLGRQGDQTSRTMGGLARLLDELGQVTTKVANGPVNYWTGEVERQRDATGKLKEAYTDVVSYLSGPDLERAFQQFITKLKNARDDNEAFSIAVEKLGPRATAAFVNAVRSGAFDNLLVKFGEVGDIIEDTRERTDDFSEAFTRNFHKVEEAFAPTGKAAYELLNRVLIPVFDGIAEAVESVAHGFYSLPEAAQSAVGYIAGILGTGGALSFAMLGLGTALETIGAVGAAIGLGGPIVTGAAAMGAWMVAFATGPWGIAIAAIVAGIVLLVTNWSDFVSFFERTIDSVGNWLNEFNEAPVRTTVDAWVAMATTMVSVWTTATDTLQRKTVEYGQAYMDWGKAVYGVLDDLGRYIARRTGEIAEFLWRGFIGDGIRVVMDEVERLPARFEGIWEDVLRVFNTFTEKAAEWATTKFKSNVADPFDALVRGLATPWNWLYDHLVGNSVIPDLMDEIAYNFGNLDAIAVQPTAIAAVKIGQKWANLNIKVFDPELKETQRLFRETFVDKLPDLVVHPVEAATETVTRQMTEFIADLGNLMRDVQSVLNLAGIKAGWLQDISDMVGAVSLLSKVINNVNSVVTFADKAFDILSGGKSLTEAFGENSIIVKAANWLGLGDGASLVEGGASTASSFIPNVADFLTSGGGSVATDLPSTAGGFDVGGGATGTGSWLSDYFSGGTSYVDDAAGWIDDMLSGGSGTADVAGSAAGDFLQEFASGLGLEVGMDGLGTYAGEAGAGLAFDFAPETLSSVAGADIAGWLGSLNPGAVLIALTKIPQIIQMFTGKVPPQFFGTIRGDTRSNLAQMTQRSAETVLPADDHTTPVLAGDFLPSWVGDDRAGTFSPLSRSSIGADYMFDFEARANGGGTTHPAVLAVMSGFNALLSKAGLRLKPSAENGSDFIQIQANTEPSRNAFGYHVTFPDGSFINGPDVGITSKNIFMRALELGMVEPVQGFATGGTALFTKPTLIAVGENGPEMGTFTPIGGARPPGGSGVTVVLNGPAVFDSMSLRRFARDFDRQLAQSRARSGMAYS